MFGNMSVQDFRISRVNGKDEMSLIRPELRAGVLIDDHFQITQDIPIEGFNMHDFNFVDDGKHALVILRGVQNSSREDAIATGLEEGLCSANFHGIAEFDVNTWEPTWNWTAWGHIGLNESKMANGPATARCDHEWDYLHANAVDKCPDGDILMSGRHTDTIYKISRATGEIVWRLGGLMNDFNMIDDLNFSRQHDVRCRAQNETTIILTLLDNAKGEDPQKPSSELSRGLRIAVNTETMEASLIQQFDHPAGPGGYAYRRGTYQQLPNDHVIMGWSEHSLLSEHAPDGTMLMQAVMLPEWVGTYRSYKFPFTGRPLDPPDVFSQAFDTAANSTSTIAYVSWNGATEVAEYRLYKSARNGDGAVEIAGEKKSGFETSMAYDGFASHVFVEALDSQGTILGRSEVFTTVAPKNLLTEAVAEELLWLHRLADPNFVAEVQQEHVQEEEVVEDNVTDQPHPEPEHEHEEDDHAIRIPVAIIAFGLGMMMAFLGVVLHRNWKNGFSIKLPWHQQQIYQRVGDEEESKEISKTSITEY